MLKPLAASLLIAAAAPAHADVVSDWSEGADKIAGEESSPGGQYTPNQATDCAGTNVAIAMFEAANAADRRYVSYLKVAPAPGASGEAAVAVAAHGVLAANFPGRKAGLDEALAFSLAQVADGPAKTAGVALGETAAKAALARPCFDASRAAPPYRPRAAPGVYIAAALPVLPDFYRQAVPFVLTSLDEVKVPPPPPLASARYAADFDEVKRLGGKASVARTLSQTAAAKFWQGFETAPMMRAIAAMPGRTLVRNARLYALAAVTSSDAGTALILAKLDYNGWRPITAIRNADEDGNPATERDAGWEPLLRTPNHPEYPCGHCLGAAGAAALFEAELGPTPPPGIGAFTDSTMPGAGVTLTSWEQLPREASLARTLGGVHFRFANEAAIALARDVARFALARFARPLR